MATDGTANGTLARLIKLPAGMLVSSLDMMAATARRLQQLYDASVDATAASFQGAPRPAAPQSSPQSIPQSIPRSGGGGLQPAAMPFVSPPAAPASPPATGPTTGPATGPATSPAAMAEMAAMAAMVEETFNGLLAFIVPGPDSYSVEQGVTTPEPGGIAAGVTGALIHSFDVGQPSPPNGPPNSVAAAGLLNQIAAKVNPAVAGSPGSAFARLSFDDKVKVFAFLETDPSMAQFSALTGLLFLVPASLAYSEYGVFDFADRCLTGWPVGWTISEYDGLSDGWDDFKGYFEDRREPLPSPQERSRCTCATSS
jgi:hypothetical protein